MTDAKEREAFDREELKRLIREALKYDLLKEPPAIWIEMRQALDYAENHVKAAYSAGLASAAERERELREALEAIASHSTDEKAINLAVKVLHGV